MKMTLNDTFKYYFNIKRLSNYRIREVAEQYGYEDMRLFECYRFAFGTLDKEAGCWRTLFASDSKDDAMRWLLENCECVRVD